jgi:hypothetical protein
MRFAYRVLPRAKRQECLPRRWPGTRQESEGSGHPEGSERLGHLPGCEHRSPFRVALGLCPRPRDAGKRPRLCKFERARFLHLARPDVTRRCILTIYQVRVGPTRAPATLHRVCWRSGNVRFEDIGLIFLPLFFLLLYWLLPFPEDDLPSPATGVDESAEEARVALSAEMTQSPRPRPPSTVEAITTLVLFGLLGAFVLLLRSVGMPRRT